MLAKLCAYKATNNHCDLVLKLDLLNVTTRFKRAKVCLYLRQVEEARNGFLISLQFDANNDEVMKELSKLEVMSKAMFG